MELLDKMAERKILESERVRERMYIFIGPRGGSTKRRVPIRS